MTKLRPRFLTRDILRVDGSREVIGEVVSRMNHPSRNVSGIPGFQDAMFLAHPLLGLPGEHVDDLLPVGVNVEWMTMRRWHRRTNDEKLVGSHDIRPAKPFHVAPCVGFVDGIGGRNKAKIRGIGHE